MIDWKDRVVSEMTYNVLMGTLNPTHSLTHFDQPNQLSLPDYVAQRTRD